MTEHELWTDITVMDTIIQSKRLVSYDWPCTCSAGAVTDNNETYTAQSDDECYCPAGTQRGTLGRCRFCDRGYYADARDSSCEQCPPLTTTRKLGTVPIACMWCDLTECDKAFEFDVQAGYTFLCVSASENVILCMWISMVLYVQALWHVATMI